MVAFYLQNSKTLVILFLCVFVFVNNLFSQKQRQKILTDSELTVQISINCDTVVRGDSIVINAIFTNTSKDSMIFYPRSIFLVKPFITFGITDALWIDPRYNNETFVLKTASGQSVKQRYKISTDNSFFRKGADMVWLSYRFSLWQPPLKKREGSLMYVIYSQKINIFVK